MALDIALPLAACIAAFLVWLERDGSAALNGTKGPFVVIRVEFDTQNAIGVLVVGFVVRCAYLVGHVSVKGLASGTDYEGPDPIRLRLPIYVLSCELLKVVIMAR